MQEARKKQLLNFCSLVHIELNDLNLLNMALTHSSYAHEAKENPKPECNERIEFLGDSVLSIIVSTYMYNNYPRLPEGDLTKIRANLVCTQSLFELAQKIHLGEYLLLGRGEALNGGRERDSILEAAFEAVLGAIYLDKGMDYARNYLLNIMQSNIDYACVHGATGDYKTKLQEYLQKDGDVNLTYQLVSCSGPEHNKIFNMEVLLEGKRIGIGTGHKKKDAEQKAAKDALEKLHIN
ncbi:MAG: ribonuclease III [Phascolarctobacterium sp.]|nr:ribonuclease III [Phascolarctobacterium sp.]